MCPDASVNSMGDDTLDALSKGIITRGQLVRAAGNICQVLMNTNAMKRLCGEDYKVEVIGFTDELESDDLSDVEYLSAISRAILIEALFKSFTR